MEMKTLEQVNTLVHKGRMMDLAQRTIWALGYVDEFFTDDEQLQILNICSKAFDRHRAKDQSIDWFELTESDIAQRLMKD